MSGAVASRSVARRSHLDHHGAVEMGPLRGRRIPLLDHQEPAGLGRRRAQVDVAAARLHAGQHDVLRQDRRAAKLASDASKRIVTMASSTSSAPDELAMPANDTGWPSI